MSQNTRITKIKPTTLSKMMQKEYYHTDYKIIFQPLDMLITENHIIDYLKDVLQKEPIKNVCIMFDINDKTYYIRELFSTYTDEQLKQYFDDYMKSKVFSTVLPSASKNPFKIYEKKFPKYNKSLLNSIILAVKELTITCKKNINFFILPKLE